MSWFNNQSVPATLAIGAQSIFQLDASLPSALNAGYTILRMVLGLAIVSPSSNVDILGAHGVSLVTQDALTAGAVPDPETDLVDWYLLDHFYLEMGSSERAQQYQWDIRSKRRIRGGDRTIVHVMDNSVSSTGTLRYSVWFRLLVTPS